MYHIEIKDGKATGNYSSTKQEWTNFELEELPDLDLRFYRLIENRLVYDEELKLEITKQSNAAIEIEMLEAELKKTDWYVIRYADTGKTIPEEIKYRRQDIRDRISYLRNN